MNANDEIQRLRDENAALRAEVERLRERNRALEVDRLVAMPKYGSFVSLKDLMDQQVTPRNDNREPGVRKLSDYKLKALLRAHYITYMKVKDGSTDNYMCTFYDEVAALSLIKDWFMVPYTIPPTGMTNDTPDNKLAYL